MLLGAEVDPSPGHRVLTGVHRGRLPEGGQAPARLGLSVGERRRLRGPGAVVVQPGLRVGQLQFGGIRRVAQVGRRRGLGRFFFVSPASPA